MTDENERRSNETLSEDLDRMAEDMSRLRPGSWPRFDRPSDCWETADRLATIAFETSGGYSRQELFQEALRLEIRALTLQLRQNDNFRHI